MSKSAHEQSFYCSHIQRFYCGQIFDHAFVSNILGLAWLTLRKWQPMPAKTKILFSVSQFVVKKQRVLYEIELSCKKDLYQYKNKIKLLPQSHME